jgi:hypothetical protein
MKNKLLISAIFVFTLAVVLHHYEKPVMAQVRAALVQNIDEPGRSPFTLALECSSSGNSNACFGTSSTAVPANKRFVVQYVNGNMSIFGSGVFDTGSVSSNSITGSTVYLDPHFVVNAFGFSTYTINMPVAAYFEAGQTPSIEIIGTSTAQAPSVVITLTGYLIDLTE